MFLCFFHLHKTDHSILKKNLIDTFYKIVYCLHIELPISFVFKITEKSVLGSDLASVEINGNLVILA